MSAPTSTVPVTCCGRSGGCVCAKEATCSCGKQPALACNCEKSATENKVDGARCSCNQRAAGVCTARARRRKTPSPLAALALVARDRRSGASGQSYPDEIDFTTKA
ncbi:unnamed protein product [Aureobasidium pullulans]|nr:unnamed protein product [Aureobasidium pullulans]